MTTYVTVEEVEDYLGGSLKASKWFAAPPADKQTAIIAATRIINRLNFKGFPAAVYHAREAGATQNQLRELADQQDLVFPRDEDTHIPRDIKDACCEIAFAILDGYNPDDEMRALATVSESIGPLSLRTTYDRTQAAEWVLAGVPSPIAWQLLRPYLRDPSAIAISRERGHLI
jgi:hypothetical protein